MIDELSIDIVPQSGYYLEDGVEERNVLERNLAAYIHPINTAGSGGGQQGTDRWASPTFFDPSDAGAGAATWARRQLSSSLVLLDRGLFRRFRLGRLRAAGSSQG